MALIKPEQQHAQRRAPAAADRRNPAQQLFDGDEAVRRHAAQTLGTSGEGTAVLIARLPDEPTASVRSAIFEALLAHHSPAVVEGLIPLLASQEAWLRNGVIEVLQQLPALVAPHIANLLGDDNPDVRIFTVNILESLRHPGVVAWLIDVLEHDPHVNVCAAAVDLLGEVGDHRAVPALRAIKSRFAGEPFIQFSADVALGQIE